MANRTTIPITGTLPAHTLGTVLVGCTAATPINVKWVGIGSGPTCFTVNALNNMIKGSFISFNANHVFAIPEHDPQDDDILIDKLRDFFVDKGYENLWKDDPYCVRDYRHASIASLEQSKIFRVKKSSEWIGLEGKLVIEVYVRFGQDKGAALDWIMYYVVNPDLDMPDPDELPTVSQIADELKTILWEDETNYAMAIATKMGKWFVTRENVLINKTEKLMAKVSTPLRAMGTYGNGETLYQEI